MKSNASGPTYFTGKPCKRGHIAERSSQNYECLQCRREDKWKRDEWRKNNRDKSIAATQAWFKKNTLKRRQYMSVWRTENRDKYRKTMREHQANRRAGTRRQKLSRGLAERLMALQRGRCAMCRRSIRNAYHLDHVMPLALGGEHKDENIQLLCPTCNQSKGAKHPIRWANERGLLL